jgi:hypothetical protein
MNHKYLLELDELTIHYLVNGALVLFFHVHTFSIQLVCELVCNEV